MFMQRRARLRFKLQRTMNELGCNVSCSYLQEQGRVRRADGPGRQLPGVLHKGAVRKLPREPARERAIQPHGFPGPGAQDVQRQLVEGLRGDHGQREGDLWVLAMDGGSSGDLRPQQLGKPVA